MRWAGYICWMDTLPAVDAISQEHGQLTGPGVLSHYHRASLALPGEQEEEGKRRKVRMTRQLGMTLHRVTTADITPPQCQLIGPDHKSSQSKLVLQ